MLTPKIDKEYSANIDDLGEEDCLTDEVDSSGVVEANGEMNEEDQGSFQSEEHRDVLVKVEDIDVGEVKEVSKFNGDPEENVSKGEDGLTWEQPIRTRSSSDVLDANTNNSAKFETSGGHSFSATCCTCHQIFYLICNSERHPTICFSPKIQCKACVKPASSRKTLKNLGQQASSRYGREENEIEKLWESYRYFEDLIFTKDCDLDDFMAEWHLRITSALSEGCQYPDPILAFKLLEKANLDNAVLKDIISSLTYPTQGESLLSQAVNRIYEIFDAEKKNYDISDSGEKQLKAEDSADMANGIPDVIKKKARRKPPNKPETVGKADFANLSGKIKLECANCPSVFFSTKKLMAHKKESHPQNNNLDEEYKTFSELAKKQNRSKPRPVYTCDHCPKSYNKTGALKNHMLVHTGQRPYSCDDCGKSFADKNYLLRHRRVHTKEKPYLCAECGDSFNFLTGYQTHMRRHTGEKPYKCNYCGEGFIKSCNKTRHIRKVHTGERPFPCKICCMKFMSGNDLKRHLRRHQAKGEAID